MHTTRTFVAIALPDSLSPKLSRLQSELAPELPGVRWSTVSPFHVTLAFLGDVEDTDLNEVCRAVGKPAAVFPPLELRVEGLGAFGDPKRPRTLWVGLAGPDVPVLEDLHSAIASALSQTSYPGDRSSFHPHVTLGRFTRSRKAPPDLTAALDRHRTWSAGSFRTSEVVTFGSTLTPEGPVYARLARSPLSGRKRRSTT